MTRHSDRKPGLAPPWVLRERNECLVSVAEDVYASRQYAIDNGAAKIPACAEMMAAATKSLRILENPKAGHKLRCHEGDRAARKFWEAKVCARRRKRTK